MKADEETTTEVLQYPNPGNGKMSGKHFNYVIKSFGKKRDDPQCIVEANLGAAVYRCELQCSCEDLADAEEVVFSPCVNPDHLTLYCPTVKGCADSGAFMRRYEAERSQAQEVFKVRTGTWQLHCPLQGGTFVEFPQCCGKVKITQTKSIFFVSVVGHYVNAGDVSSHNGVFLDFRLRITPEKEKNSVVYLPDDQGSKKYVYCTFSRLEEFTFFGVCNIAPATYDIQLEIKPKALSVANTYYWDSTYGYLTAMFL